MKGLEAGDAAKRKSVAKYGGWLISGILLLLGGIFYISTSVLPSYFDERPAVNQAVNCADLGTLADVTSVEQATTITRQPGDCRLYLHKPTGTTIIIEYNQSGVKHRWVSGNEPRHSSRVSRIDAWLAPGSEKSYVRTAYK